MVRRVSVKFHPSPMFLIKFNWFDRRSKLLGFTGVLVLGIGDAMVGHVFL